MASRKTTVHHDSSLVTQTAKWLALLVTSGAALVSFLSDSNTIGLFGWVASEGLSLSDYVARNVRLAPRADTAWAIGDTIHLAATVTDKRGGILTGATLVWHSLDPAIVSVDSSGTVVTRGPGVTGIVVAVRDHSDTTWITSAQRLSSIRIDVDSSFVVPEQGARQLFAMALDPRRHEILGGTIDWSSDDVAVLEVDSLGTATGVVPGEATVTARLDGVATTARVRVVPAPGEIALVDGSQRARVGRALPRPVAVRIWSRGGTPMEGARVRFYPLFDNGWVTDSESVADRQGLAQTSWTLGPLPGRQRLRVSVEGADSALTVVADADPDPANLRVELINDSLVAGFGQPLADTVVVEATDTLGRVIPDLPVKWSTKYGSIRSLDGRTDSLGRARARWTLGARAGRQVAVAMVGNPRTNPPLEIEAWAKAGRVSRAEVVAGDRQHGTVGRGLSRAVVVRALDEHDNPVPGMTVHVRPRNGTVADSILTTDAGGRAAVGWTLGRRAGTQKLEFRVSGVKATLIANATAAPRGSANVRFLKPPASGPAGKTLKWPVVVQVTDAYGNPVADQQVFFSGPAGVVNPQRAMTGDDGKAGTRWTLGTRKGRSWLQAVVRGTRLKAVLKLEVK